MAEPKRTIKDSIFKDYVEEHKLSLYREKKVSIPRPELYVVYTGNKKHVPDELKLSSLFEGDGAVELSVKVLRDDGKGSIVDQYIAFSKIVDEQVKLHGRTDTALYETLRICRERKILKPFLDSREKEVVDIMTTLFDQEKVMEIELYNLAQEKLNEGRAEGRMEGREEGQAAVLRELLKQFSLLDASKMTGIPQEEIKRLTQQN